MWNRTKNQITVVMIRHGETQSNNEGRYLGWQDEALADAGIKRLLCEAEAGRYPNVDVCYTSPMLRCRQSADLLYPDCVRVENPFWKEIDFGDLEGKTFYELEHDENYRTWVESGGRLPFPGGESRDAFCERTLRGFSWFLHDVKVKREERQVSSVGVVAHGGTIMAVLGHLFCADYYDYQVKPTEGYAFSFDLEQEKAFDLRKLT